ncbi:hypothetical protein C5Y93_02245 [Blastopirellula marina]|uniref:Uncharacterized protein n=1 Tax=Blastopirellula marina TaxID=124 RepID=A0A2S8GTX6_9BACT|nr:hypothetical protein C5Y93_02245 [Blastopirellula marina]
MNYRQPTIVETMIWLAAAVAAAFVAVGVALVVAMVGAVMLLARMAGEAARNVYRTIFGDGVRQRHYSREQGVRPAIIEGQVISRNR